MIALSNNRRIKIFTVLLLGSCISSFIHTALNTALAPIMQQLQVTAGTVQWLTSVYSLVIGVMVLATPFLIRRIPSKRLYMVSMSIFCLGLLLSAVASSFPILLLGRILQAVGCGVLGSLTQVVILAVFPMEKRGSMMGIYGLAVCTLPVLAPTVAGIIIDIAGWQMIFWGTLAVSLVVLAVGSRMIENFAPAEKLRFDMPSMCLCSSGFLGVVLGLGNWNAYSFASLQVLLPVGLGVLSLAAFVHRQSKMEKPFLDLSVFSDVNFRLAVLASMLLYSTMMAVSTLTPLYLQSLRGLSATVSGLVTMPGSLLTAVFSMIAGRLYDKIGIRKLYLVGTCFVAIGSIPFCFLTENTMVSVVAVIFAVRSIGIGMLLMTTVTWGMSTVSSTHTADGTAILSSLRTIAGAVGSAVFVALMTAVASSTDTAAMLVGVRAAFVGIAVVSVFMALLAVCKIGVH